MVASKLIVWTTVFVATFAASAGTVRAWWHFNAESAMSDETGRYVLSAEMASSGITTLTPRPVEGVRRTPFLADANGNVTWLDANVGDALPVFNGSTGCEIYISAGANWQLLNELFPVNDDNTVKSFTIELIAKVGENSSGNLKIITLGGGYSSLIAVVENYNSCYVSCGNDSNGVDWQVSSAYERRALPRDGQWHHLALVYDEAGGANGEGRIFVYSDYELLIDHTIVANELRPGVTKLTRNAYGRTDRYGTMEFPAGSGFASYYPTYDELRISDGVLTPSEMLHIASRNPTEFLFPMNSMKGYNVWDGATNNAYASNPDCPKFAMYDTGDHGTSANPAIPFEDRGELYRCEWGVMFDSRYPRAKLQLDPPVMALMGADAFTIECFARVTTSAEQVIFSRGSEWSLGAADGKLMWKHGEKTVELSPIGDGNWHAVALAYSPVGPAYRVYLDGVSAGTIDDDVPLRGYDAASGLNIGNGPDAAGLNLSGGMVGLRGTPYVRSPLTLLKRVAPSQTPTELAHWTFDAPGRVDEDIGATFGTFGSTSGESAYNLRGGYLLAQCYDFTQEGPAWPKVSSDIPAKYLWDEASFAVVNPDNSTSVKFTNLDTPWSSDGTTGTVLETENAKIVSPVITVECFAKLERPPETSCYCGDFMSMMVGDHGQPFRWSMGYFYGGQAYAYGFHSDFSYKDGARDTSQIWGSTLYWQHVAMQLDASVPGQYTVAVFIDYEKVGETTIEADINACNEAVNNCIRFGYGYWNPLNGWLDEPRIHAGKVGPEHFMRAFTPRADLTALWLADGADGQEHYSPETAYLTGTFESGDLVASEVMPYAVTKLKTPGRPFVRVGGSVEFGGRKNGMTIPCIATVGTTNFTVEATVRGRGGLFRKARVGGTSWGIRVNAAGQAEAYFDRFVPGNREAGADTLVVTPQAGVGIIDDNAWHHVAFVVDREASAPRASLFVDGVEVANCDIAAMQLDGGDLKIGEAFTGQMLGLRFSPGALSAEKFLCAKDGSAGFLLIFR